jgi:hypothetical protein
MSKRNLTRASRELFRREPDERCDSLPSLMDHCHQQRDDSRELWWQPDQLATQAVDAFDLKLAGGDGAELRMTDWSFTQLCSLCRVHKGTVNQLRANTAAQIFRETLPSSGKPMQVLATDDQARAIHGASYTRLYNSELLDVVADSADGFEPPPKGINGATGLYCGDEDMFCFLIDPNGWIDINGEQFAPGMFCWNSEVGKRSLGVQTFWYQRICGNHIVWDAVEVVEFTRKHTANVRESLSDVRDIVCRLVNRRDERRDGFAQVIKTAMGTRFAASPEEAIIELTKQGITRSLAVKSIDYAREQGSLTVFSVVDALTRQTQTMANAGDRTALDQKAARLLSLAV